MALTIKAAWPNPQRNSFKVPFEMAARRLQEDKDTTLEYTPFMGAQEEFQALLGSEVDVGFATAPQIVSLTNSGANVRLILGYLQRQPFRLVTRSEIQTIGDLRGKTLSVQLGAGISEQALKFTLAVAGLEEGKDYNLVPIIPIPDILDALASGTIDGGPLGIDTAYNFIEQHPANFHILGGPELDKLPEMLVVGWITTEEILKDRAEAVELFISHLGAAYNEAYSTDVSVLAKIAKEMTYLEDYSIHALQMSLKDYVGCEIWPKRGLVREETWDTSISELRKLGMLEKGIPFQRIAYHKLKGGN